MTELEQFLMVAALVMWTILMVLLGRYSMKKDD